MAWRRITSALFLVVGGLLLSHPAAALSDENTYELRLDGLVSASVVSSYKDPSPIPYDMIQDLSTAFTADICETYSKLLLMRPRSSMDRMAEDETRMLDLVDQRCYEIKSGGGRCAMDFYEEETNMSLHVETHFYLSHRRSVAVRLGASLTCSEKGAHYKGRETLVQVVSKIEAQLELENGSAWSIQRRLSLDEMTQTWEKLSSASAAQLDREHRASSVESMILENSRLKNRTRIEARKSDTSRFVEVWQFEDPDRVDPVRALFIDGQLQTITSFAGAAHAEALVHPVMIAHPHPTRVAVVSLEPSALVREVLKYKSIQKVTALGADMLAVEISKRLLPSLQDCSFLENASTGCMDQDGVELVTESFASWLRDISATENQHGKYYDVILVDVPNGGDEWLSPDMYTALYWLTDDGNITVVISCGSAPSLFDAGAEYTETPRDRLLRTAALYEENGGLGMDAMLFYDEPLAKPLPSSYFVFFADAFLGYDRFVRRNAVLVDDDIVERFHTGINPSTGRPTEVFDGPQSELYQDISRVWEDWFCKTEPGRSSEICKSTLSNLYDKSFHYYDTEVRRDKVKGRSLFARTDIPAGHFVLPNDAGFALHIRKEQWDALNKFIDDFPDVPMYPNVRDFILAYGFEDSVLGHRGWSVSFPSNNTFTNHGCTEDEVNVGFLKGAYAGEGSNDTAFSPPLTRRSHLFGMLVHTTRDVKAGEEIMVDYMTFRNDDQDPDMRKFLDTICAEGIGLIPAEGANKDDEL